MAVRAAVADRQRVSRAPSNGHSLVVAPCLVAGSRWRERARLISEFGARGGRWHTSARTDRRTQRTARSTRHVQARGDRRRAARARQRGGLGDGGGGGGRRAREAGGGPRAAEGEAARGGSGRARRRRLRHVRARPARPPRMCSPALPLCVVAVRAAWPRPAATSWRRRPVRAPAAWVDGRTLCCGARAPGARACRGGGDVRRGRALAGPFYFEYGNALVHAISAQSDVLGSVRVRAAARWSARARRVACAHRP